MTTTKQRALSVKTLGWNTLRWNPSIVSELLTSSCRRMTPYNTTHHNTTQHNTTQHNTTQHSKAQHSTAQHSTAQHSTAQHSTAQHSTAQRSAAQHSTAQHSTAQHSTAQHSTAQHSTAQHSTAQHSTAQHSTAQHSTAQHSTAHTAHTTHNTSIVLEQLASCLECRSSKRTALIDCVPATSSSNLSPKANSWATSLLSTCLMPASSFSRLIHLFGRKLHLTNCLMSCSTICLIHLFPLLAKEQRPCFSCSPGVMFPPSFSRHELPTGLCLFPIFFDPLQKRAAPFSYGNIQSVLHTRCSE